MSSASRATESVTEARKIQWQTTKIVAIVPKTARVKSFFFEFPEPFDFVAGQHVDVRLTAPDGYAAERSYSIASAPDGFGPNGGKVLELAIEKLEDGEVSPFFHDVAEVGDDIEMRGPIGGHFVWSVADPTPVLLIGGGSGIVPLMSMLRHRAARASRAPMAMLVSFRTWDDVIFRDELLELASRQDGFHLALTLTREAPRRPAYYDRRIDAAMVKQLQAMLDAPIQRAFVCGSNAFVNAAADSAIATGLEASNIRVERYGG